AIAEADIDSSCGTRVPRCSSDLKGVKLCPRGAETTRRHRVRVFGAVLRSRRDRFSRDGPRFRFGSAASLPMELPGGVVGRGSRPAREERVADPGRNPAAVRACAAAWVALASALLDRGRPRRARRLLRRALRLDPSAARAHELMARAALRTGCRA